MALQSGVIQFRGKLGRTVGRRNGNESIKTVTTRGMNVLATAPETVSNPKTAKQASQRMRMRAAVNFYRGLSFILNHSWQGTPYKAKSRNRFMQYALQSDSTVIPFLTKGDERFVPGDYLLSTGALVGAQVTNIDSDVCQTTIKLQQSSFSTVGALVQDIIASNGGFVAGDKLTFVIAMYGTTLAGEQPASQNDLWFKPLSLQLVLNPDDATTLAYFETNNFLSLSHNSGKLTFEFVQIPGIVCAGAVIQSRVPADGSTSWQRSNARFYLDDIVLDNFMTADQYNIALASYQGSEANVNSDWYLNFAAYDGDGLSSGSNSTATLFSLPSIQLPEYTAQSYTYPAVTLSNVAVLNVGRNASVIVNPSSNGSGQLAYYNKVGTMKISEASAVNHLRARLQAAGYSAMDLTDAISYGVIVSSSDEPQEDTP